MIVGWWVKERRLTTNNNTGTKTKRLRYHIRIHTRAEPSILEQGMVPHLNPNLVIIPHEKPVMRSRSEI
jgi:hypothetical protein